MPCTPIFIHIVYSMISFKQYFQEAITLTSQYHSELNPKLWDTDTLKSEVRMHLLKISSAWAEFSNIPKDTIRDILMVGGNANFNYTPHSDIDLHILIDKNDYKKDPKMFDEYFKDKKELWSNIHNISIYGHDVELYAQAVGAPSPSDQGVYSILHDEWVKHPKHEQVRPESNQIQTKVEEYADKIDSMISSKSPIKHFLKLKEKLKNMRIAGLKHSGEFSIENIVFKELRNLGYIDHINDHITSNQDKDLSL